MAALLDIWPTHMGNRVWKTSQLPRFMSLRKEFSITTTNITTTTLIDNHNSLPYSKPYPYFTDQCS